ncbi:MAG: N-formylglutamate amidohydrolase [Hyphomicrobiales bacterium]
MSIKQADYIRGMLERHDRHQGGDSGASGIGGGGSESYELIEGDFDHGLILVCDHATNAIPAEYGTLGMSAEQLERHIAYDIGVEAVTRRIAEALGAPAVLSKFSRLLIDPNRGETDPTMVMRISDGAVVPGNARIDRAEIERRMERFYRPYDNAVGDIITRSTAHGVVPALFSIHSFTPVWRGTARKWHVGVLWDKDPRVAVPLLKALGREPELVVGDNEPYSGELEGDTMNRHGTGGGLAHALLEIRQDLIADDAGVTEWADRLISILPPIIAEKSLHQPLGS